MEQTQPEQTRRSASFNPEAATFSPTAAKVGAGIGTGGSALQTSSQHRQSLQDVNNQESPFRTARDMHSIYHSPEEMRSSRLPGTLPDQKHMPLEELQEMLRSKSEHNTINIQNADFAEHRIALNQDRPSVAHNTAFHLNPINSSVPYAPPGLFPAQREPNFSAPEVDELSANLGLPGMKRRNKIEESPENSQASRDHADHSEDSLYAERDSMGNQTTRVVQPPPGFAEERPRMIRVEERNVVSPAAMEPQLEYEDHEAFTHSPRFSDFQSVNALPQQQHKGGHVRRPSDRRQYRSRASTRTKRTDQGPEPSAADIYPDDAFQMPPPQPSVRRRSSYAPEPATRFQQPRGLDAPAPRALHVEDVISWPTPAELYTQHQQRNPERNSPLRHSTLAGNTTAPNQSYAQDHPPPHPPVSSLPTILSFLNQTSPPVSRLSSPPSSFLPSFSFPTTTTTPPLEIFANHTYPNATDISAADAEVDMLLSILPRIFDLELPNLPSDGRPLTPGQQDGRRYGLRFYGLGLGDEWRGWDGV
ncbi:hypothetical protein DDE82_004250 [Stemphylium lycopersici]|uniref:Uncharacterized protein n=1 Tax=Stemphylium lycopersici TaxID=183478 RepID=A0A364MTQ8_STELY|nr:hypothetical protein TW65_07715 [Stemphylium lycopersici]RAR03194.1 hypothetical protein DDE83_008314 [Stemphylium lycopersici]RAR04998.1 hypothetical protein DDE82_004250 [Stemphylium lycopersici]